MALADASRAPDAGADRPARAGTLILVTGPSGAGKDTLLDGARAALAGAPGLGFARRVVTRPAGAGGEDHEAADPDSFAAMAAAGALFVHWQAHGLGYGARAETGRLLAGGTDMVLNGSRAAVPAILARWPRTGVIAITAPPEAVAARLARRGREDPAAVALRRARVVPPLPEGVPVVAVANETSVAEGVDRLVAAIATLRALPDAAFADAATGPGATAPATRAGHDIAGLAAHEAPCPPRPPRARAGGGGGGR